MQKPIQLIPCCKIFAQVSAIIGAIFLLLTLTGKANAASHVQDTSAYASIRSQLAPRPDLKYPKSVARFYKLTH